MAQTSNTAAMYLRSSKDRSDVSIDAQRRSLTEHAAKRGLQVVREYTDVVESAKSDRRPAFQEMIRDLKLASRTWSTLLILDTSRLFRQRFGAMNFKWECKKRGVTVVFANLPDVDPVTRVIVEAVFEAMDEVHSLMSKTKGLAGMAENVRQGFRAGGRAPFGYRLKAIGTGAIREGEEVTKSKLEPDENAHAIGRYLRARAANTVRADAAAAAGLKLASTTLVSIEWNALTYSGCTVWNVHAERQDGAAIGGRKRRPRSEWVIQEGTHEALISRDQAEQLLQRLESSPIGLAVSRGKTAASGALLSGLLRCPGGRAWHSDGNGAYRVPARRVPMREVDAGVQQMFFQDLRSPAFVRQLLNQARIAADGNEDPARDLRLELISLTRNIEKALSFALEMEHPAPALRKASALEAQRDALAAEIKRREGEYANSRALAVLTEENIRELLERFIVDMQTDDRRELKRVLAAFVDRVELDPGSLKCRIHYRIPVDRGSEADPGNPSNPLGNAMDSPSLTAASALRLLAVGRRRARAA